jgi:(E)-4-hydroxy-3-methylbut-2-enyl-diphosphate synthase
MAMPGNNMNYFYKMPRRVASEIRIGNVIVGGDAPVTVQSMTKTDTRNIAATVNQIKELEEYGCEIIRVAVPDFEGVDAIAAIKRGISIPLVADIHFDYRLALGAIEAGADALRLNPGNIGSNDRVIAVVKAAKERSIPIRIGVNGGSLPRHTQDNSPVAERMVSLAMEQVRLLESLDFDQIKVSLKAFDIATTIEAYGRIASQMSYPLHLGITESGLPQSGSIRSALGIGILLYLGIGDTIRVSLTAPPYLEVMAGYEILKSMGLRQRGATLVSCPTCGRTRTDLMGFAAEVEQKLAGIEQPIKVAVMGCEVNGPGEARDADVGIACGKGRGAIFKYGNVLETVEESDFLNSLMTQVKEFLAAKGE